MGINAAQAMIARHHNHHAKQPEQHTTPAPQAHLILEHEARDQRTEQRRGLGQDARSASADTLLSEVDRHVVQAHGKEAQAEHQGQISQARQANALEHRDHGHEHRGQQEAQERQVHRVIGLQADMDAGRGVAPARHDKRHGQNDFPG
ncbi:hypothetical protein D9M71_382820 [compost metagenome]